MTKRNEAVALVSEPDAATNDLAVHGMDELAPLRRRRAIATTSGPLALAPSHPTSLVALVGSGNVGKSVIARLIAEWARSAQRPVGLADADRHHPTLAGFFRNVMRPEDAVSEGVELTDAVMKIWFESILREQLANRASVVFDIGGGDPTFARVADELDLVAVLRDRGVMPVAVHVLSPRIQDLTDLQDMEAGSFRPDHTMLVLNEGCIRGDQQSHDAFALIRKHPVYRAALERGAVEIVLPALKAMREVDRRRLTFAQAAAGQVREGQAPLSPFDTGRVKAWLVAAEAAFAPVKAWLP